MVGDLNEAGSGEKKGRVFVGRIRFRVIGKVGRIKVADHGREAQA